MSFGQAIVYSMLINAGLTLAFSGGVGFAAAIFTLFLYQLLRK